MDFLFRKPRFPIIVVTDDGLIGAHAVSECAKKLTKVTFAGDAPKPVIDSNAEGFALHPERMIISPLTMKKRWSKAEIISLYNERKMPALPVYASTSLGNKTLERIVHDIVGLLTGRRERRRGEKTKKSRGRHRGRPISPVHGNSAKWLDLHLRPDIHGAP